MAEFIKGSDVLGCRLRLREDYAEFPAGTVFKVESVLIDWWNVHFSGALCGMVVIIEGDSTHRKRTWQEPGLYCEFIDPPRDQFQANRRRRLRLPDASSDATTGAEPLSVGTNQE